MCVCVWGPTCAGSLVRGRKQLSFGAETLVCLLSSFTDACVLSRAFAHPQDYGTEEMKQIGKDVVAREMESGLTDSAKRLLARKMVKVEKGDHDVYI